MDNPKKYNQQPNKITLSRQQFSVIEKRIVYLIINRLDTGFDVNKDLFQNKEFSIPVKEIGEINYHRLKQESTRLQSRRITFIDNEDKQEFDSITPFPRVRYKNGILYVTMFADVMPHFVELKKGFTSYQLQAALSLNSTYSQRLYELLSKYKDTGVWNNVELEHLKQLLSIDGKYEKISAFKQYVLTPAQTELKKKTDISFTYELFKTGRRYTHITFKIHHRKPQQTTEPQKLTDKQARCKKYLDELGVKRADLQNKIIYKKQSEFWTWLKHYRQNKSKIDNPAGHLLKTLGIYKTKK
jgi:plasmid replication initiation protein